MRIFRFLVTGVVQGVGFRPYIYNACVRRGVKGHVKNVGNGVEIVVDDREALEGILARLPPLARIDSLNVTESEVDRDDTGIEEGFRILESEGEGYAEVPPDLFLCEECLKELRDPDDRRHGYFFITCTDCGPRFTVTKRSPYDRRTTSMDDFAMCDACRKEYVDPSNRRYHAQTIACHGCGPKLRLLTDGKEAGGIDEAARLLKRGEVVAIKGVGGFHLACRMAAAAKLRRLTKRKDKPYALICADLAAARRIALPTEEEGRMLESIERPIVLVKKRDREAYALVSELDTFGIMLPYTALHHLLLDRLGEPLIMTSANWTDEPITTRAEEQFVPYILDHDREIVNPADDSVIKVIDEAALLLRRSRGFAPRSIPLESDQDILAMGAEMNSAFCVVKGGRAILSPFLGNTSNEESLKRYKEMLGRFLELTGARPAIVAVDEHPSYSTSILGRELAERFGARLVKVQHHAAHVAAVAAEHRLEEYVGIAMDGLGYGSDGKVWGGEIFSVTADRTSGSPLFERIGHLEEQPQMGGDMATRYPKRMLFGILSKALSEKELLGVGLFPEDEARLYMQLLKERFNTPMTTSAGRVLDAAAALLGLCDQRTYDGRPAMLLESVATEPLPFGPVIEKREGRKILLTTPLFRFLVEHRDREGKGRLAATAQRYLAEGMWCIASESAGGRPILFSGGVCYNRQIGGFLKAKGAVLPSALPAGDGGVCFGQAAVAAASSGVRLRRT